jgi:hypothetical protein
LNGDPAPFHSFPPSSISLPFFLFPLPHAIISLNTCAHRRYGGCRERERERERERKRDREREKEKERERERKEGEKAKANG